eukprot:202527_1
MITIWPKFFATVSEEMLSLDALRDERFESSIFDAFWQSTTQQEPIIPIKFDSDELVDELEDDDIVSDTSLTKQTLTKSSEELVLSSRCDTHRNSKSMFDEIMKDDSELIEQCSQPKQCDNFVSEDTVQSTPIVNANASNPSIDLNNITEDELRNIIDSIEIDMLSELEHVAHLNNGMTQCSNRADNNYNDAFTCNTGGTCTSNSSRRHNTSRNSNNGSSNNSDDHKQNDDRDDKKLQSFHGCNHLRECGECVEVFTRQSEHIKFLIQMLHG